MLTKFQFLKRIHATIVMFMRNIRVLGGVALLYAQFSLKFFLQISR